jgi:hypothetical protein
MNGTIQGNFKVVTGQSGQALQFNGTNSSVQDYAAAPFTSNLTLSAWINTTNAARDEAIIARYDAAGPGTGYIFRTDANGHLEMVFGAYNGGSISSPLVDTAIVNDGRWHHVAAVITLGKGVQFYVDGNATANVPAQIRALDSGFFNVGMNSYTPFGNYFTGTIDEVQVYSRALASNEVSAVYAFSGGQAANSQTSISTASTGSTSTSSTSGSNNGTTQGSSGTTTTQTQGSGSSNSTVPSSPVTSTSTATQLPSGLALHYTFDSSSISGNSVADVSGNNLNGTIQGAVKVVSGQNGQALQFNGTNAAVQNYLAAPFNGSLTLSAWILTTNTSRSEAIISRYTAAGPGTGYIFRTDGSGHLEMVFGGYNGGSISTPMVDTAVINDGRWHHVAAVIMPGTGVQFYVDGKATANIPGLINALDGGFFSVGVNPYTPFGNYFTGSIDDVQVYNRALAANEIATVYVLSGTPQSQTTATQASTSTGTNTSTSSQTTPTPALGMVSANPASLSFGNVNVSANLSKSFSVSNSRGSSLAFSNVSISGAGFSVSGLPIGTVLTPGQSVAVTVTFAPAAAGIVSGSLTLSSDASNPSVVIGFSATGVQPTPTTLPVNLSWSASTSAGVTGYNVYRGTSSSGPFTLLTSSPVTSTIFTDSTAQAGQTYYYVVTAVATGGVESSYSNVAVAVMP